ncbi:MAG: hypothetical protein ACRDY0_11945, partial [Acidimicrobiales bacterium]
AGIGPVAPAGGGAVPGGGVVPGGLGPPQIGLAVTVRLPPGTRGGNGAVSTASGSKAPSFSWSPSIGRDQTLVAETYVTNTAAVVGAAAVAGAALVIVAAAVVIGIRRRRRRARAGQMAPSSSRRPVTGPL